MEKTSIKIVVMGNLRHNIDFSKIKKIRSRFFKIDSIENINSLPKPSLEDGYWDISYSREEIQNTLKDVSHDGGVVLGIMNYRFNDNFYLHRLAKDKACLSIDGIDILLLEKGISLENFIIKNIYEMIVVKTIFPNATSNNEAHSLVHLDTRGCLFDMNGYRYDVVYNTEKPSICDECKAQIQRKSLPNNYIKNLEKELKKIKKPFLRTLEIFIRNYPLLSVILTFLFSFIINFLSNGAWELFKKLIILNK